MFIRTFSDYNLRSVGTYLGYIAFKHATAKRRNYTPSTRSTTPRIHSAKTRSPKTRIEKLSKAESDYICSDPERFEAYMTIQREKLWSLQSELKTVREQGAAADAARREKKRIASLSRRELAAERLAKHRNGENPYG